MLNLIAMNNTCAVVFRVYVLPSPLPLCTKFALKLRRVVSSSWKTNTARQKERQSLSECSAAKLVDNQLPSSAFRTRECVQGWALNSIKDNLCRTLHTKWRVFATGWSFIPVN